MTREGEDARLRIYGFQKLRIMLLGTTNAYKNLRQRQEHNTAMYLESENTFFHLVVAVVHQAHRHPRVTGAHLPEQRTNMVFVAYTIRRLCFFVDFGFRTFNFLADSG